MHERSDRNGAPAAFGELQLRGGRWLPSVSERGPWISAAVLISVMIAEGAEGEGGAGTRR